MIKLIISSKLHVLLVELFETSTPPSRIRHFVSAVSLFYLIIGIERKYLLPSELRRATARRCLVSLY